MVELEAKIVEVVWLIDVNEIFIGPEINSKIPLLIMKSYQHRNSKIYGDLLIIFE